MAFVPASPPPGKSAGINARAERISASLNVTRTSGKSVFLYFNKEAQRVLFGGSIVGRRLTVELGTGDDAGIVRVRLDERGNARASGRRAGGAQVQIAAWGGLPDISIKAENCEYIAPTSGGHLIRLPEWAQPRQSRLLMTG